MPPFALLILLTMAPHREIGTWRPTDDGLVANAGAVHVRLRALSESAIRVVAWPVGSPEPSRASLAVVARATARGFETREEAGAGGRALPLGRDGGPRPAAAPAGRQRRGRSRVRRKRVGTLSASATTRPR